jgi:hypothetical protein
MIKINITNILIALILIILALNLFGLFRRPPEKGDSDKILQGYEIAIEQLRKSNDQLMEMYDREIERRFYQDSVLQKQDTKVITKYEKVPVVINNYDKEQLRIALSKYDSARYNMPVNPDN